MPRAASQLFRPGSYALLILCFVACKDGATIGALCPAGCDFQVDAAVCACTRDGVTPCASTVCRADAAACAAQGCGSDDDADACAAPGCRADDAGTCAPGTYPLERTRLDLLIAVDDSATVYPWWPQL